MEYARRDLSNSADFNPIGYDAITDSELKGGPGKLTGHLGVFSGLSMLLVVAMAFVALATWSIHDPSLSNANGNNVTNWMGYWGASFADLLIQFLGLGAAISLFPPAIIGWLKILRQPVGDIKRRLLCWPLMSALASGAIACFAIPQSWPLPSGLGGVVGDMLLKIPALLAGTPPTGWFAALMFVVFCLPALVLALYSSALINRDRAIADNISGGKLGNENFVVGDFIEDDFIEDDNSFLAIGAFTHWYLYLKSRLFKNKRQRKPREPGPTDQIPERAQNASGNWAKNLWGKLTAPADDSLENYPYSDKREPEIGNNLPAAMPEYGEQIYEALDHDLAAEFRAGANNNHRDIAPIVDMAQCDLASDLSAGRVKPMAPKPKQSTRDVREAQSSMFEAEKFELPSLFLLSEPKNLISNAGLSEDALEQNARLLEGVLGDFGVKGEIINVRPGPVVTLYELEPAPGIKSSRVIGLADDIARSMSAIAARVAVIPGRNAIGIELPNHRRETVYLREVLASDIYERSKAKLPIILGKNIGGEPILADLAKMPHLLVAGTTGSGKSVAINTMILSILYRLTPNQVKMIMIDPKMLELSIYDGIPHLLTPVVTDPKKAVVALKWTVREMEERYKNMSKLGVRNIDGYNSRLAQAVQKNEVITKTVQTGFDRETGEAIYETEELDLNAMPFIVVIIDEMADLMMVAGKDIEGTVQRLAQMARAAGIHVVMATQRPSVDVITGTIKANFPTRISFQVTSKIDSRTILGEQGAEQLLGMGDMLYQAGGGRIVRVHGPFVDDDEVEKIVTHLKTQGTPQYLSSVTEDSEDEAGVEGADSAGDLSDSADIYDQAVSVVLNDRKVSTSYIQRRLSIGYNRAATLIERMEQEGLISSANHAGKREILVPGEDETI